MNKLEIAKKAITLVIGLGASKISSSIIKNNVPVDSVIDKITVSSATIVIGMMAGEATKKFTGDKIDELVAQVTEQKNKFQEAKKTQEV